MAIFHCSIKIVKRSEGRSVVAAAAYRAGEKIKSEYDGTENDYTRKRWIEHTEIMLPENAPKEFVDRKTLWNSVEENEKGRNSQLAREIELALPVEFDLQDNVDLVRDYVKDNFVDIGMCADIAIHNPPARNDINQPVNKYGELTNNIEEMIFNNPHAHILLTMRPMDENGNWEAKSQKEYVCIKDGTEAAFTGNEFNVYKEEGWEKQYKYKIDGETKWLPKSIGDNLELERIDRSPKTTPYGRKNETIEYYNDSQRAVEWRNAWETAINSKAEELGFDFRVDARSYEEQGVDKIATIHMGVELNNIRKRNERNCIRDDNDILKTNRLIEEHNELCDKLAELRIKEEEIIERRNIERNINCRNR